VYEAVHEALGKRVALKVFRGGAGEHATARARFAREARIAASLRHPNIAEVYDFGRTDDADYLALELADRTTLAELLEREGVLSLSRVVDLFLPIISAIAYAHEHGVVHRDLKPANILLAQDRFGALVPKVADFGIGKTSSPNDARLTDDGRLLGTLAYMAPEQVRDARTAEAAADQYAIGMMLYEALTGTLPYEAPTTLERMNAILAGGASAPSQVVAAQGGDADGLGAIDELVLRAIHVRVDGRYPSVKALGAALLGFATGQTWSTWARELTLDDVGMTADVPRISEPPVMPPVLIERAPQARAGWRPWKRWARPWGPIGAITAGAALAAGVAMIARGATAETPRTGGPVVALEVTPSVLTESVDKMTLAHEGADSGTEARARAADGDVERETPPSPRPRPKSAPSQVAAAPSARPRIAPVPSALQATPAPVATTLAVAEDAPIGPNHAPIIK
jgi:serine/threonine-protein kinase